MKLSTPAIQKLIVALSLLFSSITAFEIAARVNTSWVIRESRLDIGYTREIAGTQTASWEFNPRNESIDKLWIFYHPISPDNLVERTLEARLSSIDSDIEIAAIRMPLAIRDFKGGRALLDFEELGNLPQERLRLQISLPENKPTEGFYLHYQLDRNSSGKVENGNHPIENSDLSMMWFAKTRPFPAIHVIVGSILLVFIVFSEQSERRNSLWFWSSILLTSSIVLLVAGYFQNLRIESFYGNYWPDEYPAMAHDWLLFLKRELSAAEFSDRLAKWRNGQAFLVPLILAVIQTIGISPAAAYQISLALFTFGSIYVFLQSCFGSN